VTLGLFPLNLVLFPQVRLPLQIFEPRYKALINGCLERGLEFGINLVEDGHMHPVGCMARVVDVVKRYPDGRLDIVIEGTRRFRLLELVSSEMPFAVGTVEEFPDEQGATDTPLLESVLERYNRIVTLVYGIGAPTFTADQLTDTPSFELAPKAGLSVQQKQGLLETPSEAARLRMLEDHLNDMLPSIVKAENIQRIIRNDGYMRR